MATAIVFHEEFVKHNLGFGHPERPERLKSTMALLERVVHDPSVSILVPNEASMDEVLRVHTGDYLDRIRGLSEIGGELTIDTPVPKGTYERALLAAGAAIMAGEKVAKGEFANAFALTRPPGHHAGRDFGGGFCFFNNIAVMIAYLKEEQKKKKILVLDWDVHHGNGTQSIFYNDPSVLYFSTHQSPLYPGTGEIDEIGAGEGEGYNVNFPFRVGTSGANLLFVLREIFKPLAEEFRPDMICISSGYDAYFDDTLASLQFMIRTYAEATTLVKETAEKICCGKIAIVLEGGYHLQAVSYGVLATILALAGLDSIEEPNTPPEQKIERYVETDVLSLKKTLSKYWKTFR